MDGVEFKNVRLFSDKRGIIFEPVAGDVLKSGGIRNAHVATMTPGAVRGNHFHVEQTETISVFGSSGIIKFRDIKTGKEETAEIEAGSSVTFSVKPGIAHAVKNTGEGTMVLVCMTDRIHDPEKPDRELVNLLDDGV